MSGVRDALNSDFIAHFGAMLAGVLAPIDPRPTKRLFRRKPAGSFAFSSASAATWLERNLVLDRSCAQTLLAAYYDAHLLHSPTNRALTALHGENIELHPTAKGFAYLQRWYTTHAREVDEGTAKAIEAALASPYNSLKLLELERSLLSHRLLFTTGLAMIIWMRLLGEQPHTYEGQHGLRLGVQQTGSSPRGSLDSHAAESSVSLESSPHYHRQMIHPNSCCHSQYWNADGIRIFRDLRFEKPAKSRFSAPKEYKLDFVMSGHSILQWIMDCTSVESTAEGIRVTRLLLSKGFLKQISDPVIDVVAAVSRADYDPVSKKRCCDLATKSLYRFTPRGRRLCAWEDVMDDSWLDIADIELDYQIAAAQLNAISSGCSGDEARDSWAWEHVQSQEADTTFAQLVTMALIQCEPALKLLFREELERLRCAELLLFVDKAHRLLLLISASYDARGTVTRRERLAAECHELLSRVCAEFLVSGAPYELNISEAARTATLATARAALADPQQIFAVAEPLMGVKSECVNMIRDILTRFATSDKTREVPGLRDYIVSKYSIGKSPCLQARRGAVHTIDIDVQILKDAC